MAQILIIDDDSFVAETISSLILHLGHVPTTALTLRDGLKQFDLVLTDMTMPKMSGDQLARAILKLNPAIPIIMGTGYSDSINRDEALALGIKEFYHKPLSTDRLVRLVRKILDENHST